MLALVYDGSVRVRELPRPEPRDGEALLRVRLAGICNTDIEITRGYKGFHGVFGHEVVGTVVESGDPRWLGKRVCPEINVGCGICTWCRRGVQAHCHDRAVLGILDRQGAFAEYVAVPTANLHVVSDSISDEQAVFVEPLAAAFEVLEQIRMRPTDRVAVLGDGKLGLLCAQVLATTDASVTMIGRHAHKLALLEGKRISTQSADADSGGEFDVVVEATGSPAGLQRALQLTRPRGVVVLKSTTAGDEPVDLSPVVVKEITVLGSRCGPFDRALAALRRQEVDVVGLISSRYRLEQADEAMRAAAAPGALKIVLEVWEGLSGG